MKANQRRRHPNWRRRNQNRLPRIRHNFDVVHHPNTSVRTAGTPWWRRWWPWPLASEYPGAPLWLSLISHTVTPEVLLTWSGPPRSVWWCSCSRWRGRAGRPPGPGRGRTWAAAPYRSRCTRCPCPARPPGHSNYGKTVEWKDKLCTSVLVRSNKTQWLRGLYPLTVSP